MSDKEKKKKKRAREKETRVSPSRAPVLSFAHYFQAPTTQASSSHAFIPVVLSLFLTRHEQEKSQGASESTELRRRIKQLEEENEEMSDNRLQLIGIILTKWSRLTYCLTAKLF